MHSLVKSVFGLFLTLLVAWLGIHWWLQRGAETSPPAAQQQSQYTQQIQSDIDFFKEKVSAGNWVFGVRLAHLNEKAFRLTNDYRYLADAEAVLRDYLTHEETAEAYVLLSSIALTQHAFDQARVEAERARSLAQSDVDHEQALGALFDAQLALGDLSGLKNTREALRKLRPEPSFATLIREARYIERMEGDLATAATLFEQACDQIADSDDVWTRAWCLTQVGVYRLHGGDPLDEVATYLQRVTSEIYPHFTLALEAQGELAALQENYPASKEYYELALEHGSSPDVYLELAEISLAQHDAARATAAWQDYVAAIGAHRVTTQSSANAVVHVRGLVQALLGLGEQEQALVEARADLNKRPQDPGALQTLAFLYLVTGNYEEALETSSQIAPAVELNGEEAFVRGAAMYKTGRIDEATPYLTVARSKERELGLRVRRVWRELLPTLVPL